MTETALPRVLCVDDEPNVLAAMERNLFDEFDVVVALSGEAGLEAVSRGEHFAVIMSDMRMPGMDGATFLSKVREVSPDSVRVLLTGQADLESSIAAINKGAIFRYLCKPCPKQELVSALNDAVSQHRLICAEKELLATTLTASVKTLTEVLAMVAPWAFQRSAFAQSGVLHALPKLGWPDEWIYTIAASLSQIGCVGVPADIIQADVAQRKLSQDEKKLIQEHPDVAGRLVERIPRLGLVAEIIRHQAKAASPGAPIEVIRGAHLLRATLELERHAARGRSLERPWEILRAVQPAIPEDIIKALADFRANVAGVRTAHFSELMPGWVVDEDILTTNGLMVLSKGHELTDTAISALQRLLAANAVKEPIQVRGLPDTAASS
ncbi:response regulator [Acerihabitans sp. TG2]|uniref:response regulator n=1 Tax=Acerihabitans sp. TG2 TaxID=3096008 RepID=UPI002B23DFF7|nr:response regulator [Acerihabitans sp. TG2]MEA9389880.1 response regulator [Acerihabitans sp. TG2]